MRGRAMHMIKLRSLFVSDVHLGTRDAHAEQLLDLLRHTECDYLYLVGDILDFWRAKSGWYWPQLNNNIVQILLDKAARGTRVIYIPGNHDEVMRDYAGMHFNGIDIELEVVHESADGRRLLVLHGDLFDAMVHHNRLLTHIGDAAYCALLGLNRVCNRVRRWFGQGNWSLSAYIKSHINNAVRYIDSYEQAALREARRQGLDGIICGHIHMANLREEDGVVYANSGDWVEHCTALIETHDGSLQQLNWVRERDSLLGDAPVGRARLASAA